MISSLNTPLLQPVPEKMRLKVVVGLQIGIVNDQSFFSNESFEKKLVMTIQDSDFYSDDYFESIFSGTGCIGMLPYEYVHTTSDTSVFCMEKVNI